MSGIFCVVWKELIHTARAFTSFSCAVLSCSFAVTFSSCIASKRAWMSSGTPFPDSEARRSLYKIKSVSQAKIKHPLLYSPEVPLALKHLFPMTDPLALQVDFLHEQPVHLFQLHPVL